MIRLITVLLALVASFHSAFGQPKDPVLSLRSGNQVISYPRSELLKRPDLTSIHIDHDPSYDEKARDYPHAIPLRPLLAKLNLSQGSVLQFECLDGFSAPISKERLLGDAGKEGSVPYLAIEGPDEHWPKTSGGKDAGPFYLVWKNPEKSKIGTEEWPFALAGFVVKDSLEVSFPKILPEPGISTGSPIRQGFNVFVKNCFACHTLNLEGQSHMGPDLNVPMSPTQYLSEANLRKLIRNPQNLRFWPESKMKGFSQKELSDPELSELIAYLKHMSKRNERHPSE